MSEPVSSIKYRFIPYRKHDIVEMCLQEGTLKGQEDDFRQLYYILSSVSYIEFHQMIESLKDSYAAVDPDADTRSINNKQIEHRDSVRRRTNMSGELI